MGKHEAPPYWGMNGVSELSDPTFIRGIKDRRELAPTKSWQCIRTWREAPAATYLSPSCKANPSCVLRRSGWPWTPLITKIPPRDWLGHVLQYYPNWCYLAAAAIQKNMTLHIWPDFLPYGKEPLLTKLVQIVLICSENIGFEERVFSLIKILFFSRFSLLNL